MQTELIVDAAMFIMALTMILNGSKPRRPAAKPPAPAPRPVREERIEPVFAVQPDPVVAKLKAELKAQFAVDQALDH